MRVDSLSKFLLEDRSARVICAQIDQTWQRAQQNQPDFPAVRQLLGELVAAAALLSANLKHDGSLLLQLQGSGIVKLIVVECRQDLSLRATIKLNRSPEPHETGLQDLMNADGQGRFSVILTPPKDNPQRQAYQGIVPLDGQTVAQVLQDYMDQSEQLETRIWLSASDSRLGGLMLQRMPDQGGQPRSEITISSDTWEQAKALCETVSPQELLELDQQVLLHRLFWQTPVISLQTLDIQWRCDCSRERVVGMLRSLGQKEVDDIVQEQGSVEVTCEFCGTPYHFDRVDAAGLFEAITAEGSQRLH
jgi:molecular chaperone Hsp33